MPKPTPVRDVVAIEPVAAIVVGDVADGRGRGQVLGRVGRVGADPAERVHERADADGGEHGDGGELQLHRVSLWVRDHG